MRRHLVALVWQFQDFLLPGCRIELLTLRSKKPSPWAALGQRAAREINHLHRVAAKVPKLCNIQIRGHGSLLLFNFVKLWLMFFLVSSFSSWEPWWQRLRLKKGFPQQLALRHALGARGPL